MTILRLFACFAGCLLQVDLCNAQAVNLIIFADVPDMAMIRVGESYYMSSTTMHMNPGLPIMKSKDLLNWELIGYAYHILDSGEKLSLENAGR
jgi:beta-xylosidase